MKIKMFDNVVRKFFYKVAALENTVISALFLFIDIDTKCKKYAFLAFCLLLLASYLVSWLYANKKKSISFRIGKTKVVVEEGDLFAETGLKVIPVNEFFDTHVGDNIIDPKSLHGLYLRNHLSQTIEELDAAITNSLGDSPVREIDAQRTVGKKIKYQLGTVYNDKNGFLLVAYTKFDKDNRAYLNPDDVMNCYMNMWNEIDKCRGNDSICLPVLGSSGLVRNLYDHYSAQQLVELVLGTFRASGINLSRGAELKIIIHKNMTGDINFLKLEDYSD